MSELVVSSSLILTGVLTGALLAALGIGRLVSGLAESALSVDRTVSSTVIGDEFMKSAQAAQERMQAQYAKLRRADACGMPASEMTKEAAKQLACASGLSLALQEHPLMAAVTEIENAERLREAQHRLAQAEQAFRSGSVEEAARLARHAASGMQRLTRLSVHRLGEAQRVVVAEQVRLALPRLGYSMSEAADPGATAFHATRGSQTLGVVVADGGQVVVDTAGFEGMQCRPAVEALFRQLREQGVTIEVAARYAHQRPDGGPLLARRGASGLLDGVRELRQRNRASSARKASTDAERRQALARAASTSRLGRAS